MIFLLGTYGQENIGDETILEIFLEFFRGSTVVVNSSNPRKTQSKFNVYSVHTYGDYRKTLRVLLNSDFIIFGGGSLLKELYANVGRWRYSVLVNVLIGVFLAKLLRKKVVFSAIGVGPLRSALSKYLVKLSVQLADLVTVRDNGSKNLLESIGVKRKIIVVADPTFLVKNGKQNVLNGNQRRGHLKVGVCPLSYFRDCASYEKIVRVISKVCDYLIEKYDAEIFLIPFQFGYNPYDDVRVNEDILKCVHNKSKIFKIEGIDSAEKMLRSFSNVDIILGVRLHSLIFALLQNVPFLAIIYDEKVENFLRDIDWKYSLDGSTLKLEELVAKFEKLLEDRMEVLREMENLKIIMTRRAMLNFHLMRQFMGDYKEEGSVKIIGGRYT